LSARAPLGLGRQSWKISSLKNLISSSKKEICKSQFTFSSSGNDYTIKTYDEQDDSVYALTWSAGSAWVFASISYSSNFIINRVPNKERLAILL